MFCASVAYGLARVAIAIYTWVTLPFYAACQCPCMAGGDGGPIASIVERKEGEITVRSKHRSSKYAEDVQNHPSQINTMSKLFDYITEKYGDRQACGTRYVRKEVEEEKDGKMLKKVILEKDYVWESYRDVAANVDAFGKGIRYLGIQPRQTICIFADTRAEWLVSALGCFKNSISLVTIYTNLGGEGIAHGISQTKVDTVITTLDLLPKLEPLLPQLNHVRKIIFFESTTKRPPAQLQGGVALYSYSQVLELGASNANYTPADPTPGDTAIIMYTSGSTGVPKGVVISHHNMVSGILSLTPMAEAALPDLSETDTYIAFLPLAHILELLAEHVVLLLGLRIGYSSPNTLTDISTFIREGDQGDATIVRPTLMAAVPLILDRIYKGVQNKIAEESEFKQKLVNYCIEYRQYWVGKGWGTPLMDRIVFSKMGKLVGGRLRCLLSGGAPLSEKAHHYIRTVLTCAVLQGYGLTETCSTACISEPGDLSVGNVGAPLNGVDLKLVDWAEGGYTVADKQGPRGEIVVGGHHVARGYLNMPEKTAEDFYEANGVMFFRTGDIGQLLPNGVIQIIDRKKDLVKLQAGEYVSLGKVESNLKINPLIENICVFGDSMHTSTVALVVPDALKLAKLATAMGKEEGKTHQELCADHELVTLVQREIERHAQTVGLEKFEVPKRVYLESEPWTPESGLVTAAFKLRRKPLEERYAAVLKSMYASLDEEERAKQRGGDPNNNAKRKSNQVLPV